MENTGKKVTMLENARGTIDSSLSQISLALVDTKDCFTVVFKTLREFEQSLLQQAEVLAQKDKIQNEREEKVSKREAGIAGAVKQYQELAADRLAKLKTAEENVKEAELARKKAEKAQKDAETSLKAADSNLGRVIAEKTMLESRDHMSNAECEKLQKKIVELEKQLEKQLVNTDVPSMVTA